MELIIELPGRGGHIVELQKFSAEKITIGRGFDNDLVLQDPHVCAHHAVLQSNADGEILLRDLGSVNGTFTKDHTPVENSCVLESGDVFYLGKSKIRLYRPEHAVPSSIRLNWVEKLAHMANKPMLAGSLCLLAAMLRLYLQYTAELAEFHIGPELLGSVGVLMLIALWPMAWTLFARYKKHDARFLAQLSATVLFVIVITLLQKLDAWLAYHNGVNLFINGTMMVISGVLVLLLLWFHLYLSLILDNKKRWLYSGVMTSLFACIVYVGTTLDNDRFTSRPEYTARLFPPSVSFYSTQSDDEFIKAADEIFTQAMEQAEYKKE